MVEVMGKYFKINENYLLNEYYSYSQSGNQEFLCYQFASLVRSTYNHLNKNLGDEFDKSTSTQVFTSTQLNFQQFV